MYLFNICRELYGINWTILSDGFFDRLNLTAEDRNRAEIYRHEQKRDKLQTKSKSIEHFLLDLEMTATVGVVDEVTISRVIQLVNKTNQFNITSRRHTAADIRGIIDDGGVALWISVEDKFGDSGIVGVAVAKIIRADEWLIDTFLLSCRVIGRQLDSVLLSRLSQLVNKEGGVTLYGEYIPTKKNSLVKEFFPQNGFAEVTNKENHWRLDLDKSQVVSPDFIKVRFAE